MEYNGKPFNADDFEQHLLDAARENMVEQIKEKIWLIDPSLTPEVTISDDMESIEITGVPQEVIDQAFGD